MPKTALAVIAAVALMVTGAGAVGAVAHPSSTVQAGAQSGSQPPGDMTWG